MGRNTAGSAYAAPVTHSRITGTLSLGALGVVLALVMLALTASSALATNGHSFADQFGIPASNDPGGFQTGGPTGIAIRQSTGDVFVSDPAHTDSGGAGAPRIERFDAAGGYLAEFAIDPSTYSAPTGLAVDPTGAGAVYVAVTDNATGLGAILKYTAAGVFVAALDFTGSSGTVLFNPSVAVDPADGTVYVSALNSNSGQNIITTFNAAGTYTGLFDGSASSPDGGFSSISSIAVDGSSRLYVSDAGKNRVDRYSAGGTWQATVDDGSRGPVGAIGVDPTSDEVYVLESSGTGPQVSWFSAGGAAYLESFGNGHITAGSGVAVNHSSGTVYTADSGAGVVERFTAFVGPTVTTEPAASLTPTSETLNGTIDPEGVAASYHFEYGLDPNYGSSTPNQSAGNGNSPVAATATVSNLLPNTQYHFRIVGTNSGGSIRGGDLTFTTAPGPPVVDGTAPFASAIKPDGATVNGSVNPRGSDTTYHFDYGTTTAYGSVTQDATTGVSQGNLAVTADLTGLTPGTTYHFRVSADNGTGGVQTGADQTFTTAPAAPAGVSSVTGISANLTGTVNPHGVDTSYHFEYGLDGNYGRTTPEASAGAGSGDQPVAASIGGLTPGTTYHVRVIATDTATSVTTTGVDGTFITDPAPAVTTGAVTGVTTTSATFSGSFNTHNLGGNYRFYVESSTNPYVGKTDLVTIGTGTTTGTATGTLNDLVPGQTYTVRLAVAGSGVTSYGDTVTFTTAPKPPGAPPAPPSTVNNPYGCVKPVLAAYNPRPKPGDTIAISGTDLGVAGTVALGSDTVKAKGWGATGFSITLPDDATGTLPLTINCGKVSNTIAIQVFKAPSNTFTATGKVKGSTATLSVKVPGPGSITITGGSVKKATKHASKAGTNSVKVTLSAAGKKSVRRHKTLTVSLKVQFTPTGGKAASKTVKVTFKR